MLAVLPSVCEVEHSDSRDIIATRALERYLGKIGHRRAMMYNVTINASHIYLQYSAQYNAISLHPGLRSSLFALWQR